MQNPTLELVFSVIFTILILIGFYFTSRIDLSFSSDLETFSGPRAYPGLILSILLFFNLITVVNLARNVNRNRAQITEQNPSIPTNFIHSAGLLIALIVFVVAFEHVGYVLTMVPLMTLAALLCGAQSTIKAALVSVILAAICLIIFRYGLATVLPEGVFGIDMFL